MKNCCFFLSNVALRFCNDQVLWLYTSEIGDLLTLQYTLTSAWNVRFSPKADEWSRINRQWTILTLNEGMQQATKPLRGSNGTEPCSDCQKVPPMNRCRVRTGWNPGENFKRCVHTWTVILCSKTDDLFRIHLHISPWVALCSHHFIVQWVKAHNLAGLYFMLLPPASWLRFALWDGVMTTTECFPDVGHHTQKHFLKSWVNEWRRAAMNASSNSVA